MKTTAIGVFSRRDTLRRLTPKVLALWCAYLVLAFLQPCCEALAASVHVPLHHPAAVHATVYDHDCGDAPQHHSPCPKFESARSLPSQAFAPIFEYSHDDFTVPPLAELLAWSHTPDLRLQAIATPSGAPPPLYLTTLRLRI
ncbi:MAG: hypothetical protein ACT4NU_12280 [Chromatiales bacterium]